MAENVAPPNKRGQYHQGIYNIQNPDKYLGDPRKCVFRSGWEKKVFKKFDLNPKVVAWGAEIIEIPYVSPKTNRVHRYYPDVFVVADNNGVRVITLIEIKPLRETQLPKAKGKKKERYLNEVITYHLNKAKWKAATAYCKNKGWVFKIMTEVEIQP
jgi:hypothetical protein